MSQFILYRTHLISGGKVILSLSKDDDMPQLVFDMLRLTVLNAFEKLQLISIFQRLTSTFCILNSNHVHQTIIYS